MKALDWVAVLLATTLATSVAGSVSAQDTEVTADEPLTLDVALEPEAETVIDAIRMTPAHAEEFVELSDQIAAVEPVDVASLGLNDSEVASAVEDAAEDLPLYRTLLMDTEIVAEAVERASISIEGVIAAPVIYGDVVSVVLYHR